MTDCKNYRGISLLNIAYKVLTIIIKEKLQKDTENTLGDYQNGFRKGRSTVDAIHILRQITEKSYEYNIDMQIIFIDFKQAFDQLKREQLMKDLKDIKIPKKIRNMIKITMKESNAIIAMGDKTSEKIQVKKGVRQGDALSSLLFTLSMDAVIKKIEDIGTINKNLTQIIAYADDVAIISRSKKELETVILKLIEEAKKRGLEVNVEKTKYMFHSRKDRIMTNFICGSHTFKEVETFKYLGITVNRKNEKQDINEKIMKGYRAFYCNKQMLKDKKLSKKTKLRIYKTIIRPIITYATETITLTEKEEEKLKILERKIIRAITGPKKISENESRQLMNHEVEEIMGKENIVRTIKAMRIRWYGHIYRSEKKSALRSVTEWKPLQNRPKGRPKCRWKEQVEDDISKLKVKQWKKQIADRKKWRKIVYQAKTHNLL